MVNDENLYEIDINSVTHSQLPSIVRSQCEILNELEEKLEIATQRLQSLQKAAPSVNENGKKVIEAIQVQQQKLAESINTNIAMQQVLDYQVKIASITKWFFNLGTSRQAMNHTTIQHLQAILRDEVSVHLSNATKAELEKTICDLQFKGEFI